MSTKTWQDRPFTYQPQEPIDPRFLDYLRQPVFARPSGSKPRAFDPRVADLDSGETTEELVKRLGL